VASQDDPELAGQLADAAFDVEGPKESPEEPEDDVPMFVHGFSRIGELMQIGYFTGKYSGRPALLIGSAIFLVGSVIWANGGGPTTDQSHVGLAVAVAALFGLPTWAWLRKRRMNDPDGPS
jgi:hypothetical protein